MCFADKRPVHIQAMAKMFGKLLSERIGQWGLVAASRCRASIRAELDFVGMQFRFRKGYDVESVGIAIFWMSETI